MSGLFENTTFLVIEARDDEDHPINLIREIIKRNSGQCILSSPESSDQAIEKHHISHIITPHYDFAGYFKAQDLMLPVTTAQWLEDSESASQRKNYRLYSPRPAPFMDKVVVCVADNLPPGDKEMMYAGVRAFGGQYLDSLSRYTTHLIAVDLSNIKSVLVANIKKREDLKIQIVLPHWLDDCFKQQKRLDEAPYRLSNSVTLRTGKPNYDLKRSASNILLSDESYSVTSPSSLGQSLNGKVVYLSADHCLSEHSKESIYELIKSCGGRVVEDFDTSALDVYIGKYREGQEYHACLQSPNIEVASLRWLYQVAKRGEYIPPLKSNALNFPLPHGHIPEFSGLRISITGYSGDARHYLSMLITFMGASFTKTLDCNNNFLVAEKHGGEKYMAVKSRWPEVMIVNHLWIEQCFAQWKFIDPSDSKFKQVSKNTPRLGTTVVDLKSLKSTSLSTDLHSNVDDSAAEETGVEIENHLSEDERKSTSLSEQEAKSPEESGAPRGEAVSVLSSPSKDAASQPAHSDSIIQVEELSSPATTRGRRSAKEKAAKRLHDDMKDLNKYASIMKSSRKMKSFMEELEASSLTKDPSAPKRPIANDDNLRAPGSATKRKKVSNDNNTWQVVILTGCEKLLNLNRADVVKLAKVGIKVVNDFKSNQRIDSIIAPRVLRTEKFLKCLSQCKRVLHPKYLVEVLEATKNNADVTSEEIQASYSLDRYSLDSILSVKKINDELGVNSRESGLKHLLDASNKGSVFKNLKLNLSSNLNGGADLIASILKEHGLREVSIIKLTSNFDSKDLLVNEDGEAILIAHKEKDKKAADIINSSDVVVVDWDWCVKSIFRSEIISFADFKI